ncbi:hypothetical protein HGA08_22595 [Nocardia vermiculata]|uniref:DUF5753 domain-containing protein n=2 Tax=Nocardia vermiculata TaxID=257274 RepID=A0A846Y2D2_9NOCA|nr:hypothetical protein [Nocardia vermiculata]
MIERHPANLDLRVVPFDAQGSMAGLNAATFHLLEFDNSRLPAVGWLETAIHGQLSSDQRQVDALDYLYSRVWSIALDRDASAALIDRIAGRLL